jgi:signal transduction histidine kinase
MLLAFIAHDFNNLLRPIVALMEELQRQNGAASPKQSRRIDGAISCALHAKILARHLFDYANPQALRPSAVDIGVLLNSLEPVLRCVLPAHIKSRIDVACGLPPVFVDRQLLERVVVNLVFNARDAMPEGGEVVVTATLDRGSENCADDREPMIRLSVADTGVGMGLETLRSAERPHFSTEANGTGPGLTMVKQLLERHGGVLSITSTLYRGTAVDLWLPVASSAVTC